MISRKEIIFLKEEGNTLSEIARALGVSRQRIHQIFSGYVMRYQKKNVYLEYRRHYAGHKHPYKPCRYCIEAKIPIDISKKVVYT